MRKQEFLRHLRKGLSGLPHCDREERLTFYSEMIDDRMEEGLTEEDAVFEIGNADEIIEQIMADTKPVKEKGKSGRRLRVWEVILLVLGSPVWLCLLIAAFAVILSVYVVLWSVIVALWAVFGSLIGCALGTLVFGIGAILKGDGPAGLAMIGAALVCAGLAIFAFYGSRAATVGTLLLTKKVALGIKNCFGKKEAAS